MTKRRPPADVKRQNHIWRATFWKRKAWEDSLEKEAKIRGAVGPFSVAEDTRPKVIFAKPNKE